VALILAGIGPMLALGRLLPVPDSLLLFGAGLASSLLPGLPPLRLDPQLALQLFLPPLLYAGTVRTSLHLLRHTLASGVLLGVAASLATAVVVAAAARALLPGLPWAAALMLGAVAAVFDTRLFHEAQGRPHVPRAVADALKAREMAARVVALSCFGLAAEAAAGGPPAPLAALGGLAWELAGGALAGAALGRGVVWLRERIDPAPVEIAVSIATPYLGALLAAALGLSTVVVIMGAALAVSAVRVDPGTGAPRTSSEARISAAAFWEEASLILSAALFFLAGRALPETAAALDDRPLPWLAGAAATLLAAVLAVEFAAGLLSARLRPPAGHAGGAAPARVAGVMAWASTRSVIGLILALSIPATLPGDGGGGPPVPRDLVLVMATLLIVGSVLLQGLTLNAVVRRAGLRDEGEREREGRAAREAEDAAGPGDPDARRRALLALRERDRIGDELLRERLREIDLVQRAGEGGALPGAGPPNP
jgi:NhaP-type Na+/H+ or K+/H+ antiporter